MRLPAGRTPELTESALDAFYAAAEHEFAGVAACNGLVERDLQLADRRVSIRCAGSELAEALLGALAARTVARPAPVPAQEHPGGSPSVTELHAEPPHASISLWEESACTEPAVPPPWTVADVGPGGLVRRSPGERTVAVHQPGHGAITLVDPSGRELLHRVPDRRRIPWWERAAPLRSALFWALCGEGRHLVHAAVVGDGRGGVLIGGASGSGKTTVALAALVRGLSYLGDDYALLDTGAKPIAHSLYNVVSVRPYPESARPGAPSDQRPPAPGEEASAPCATAHSVYRWAKLDRGHLARFPGLADAARFPPAEAADQKAVLDVAALRPEAMRDRLPIRAVLLPRVRGGHTRVASTTPTQALLALAPSTTFQMPFDDGQVLGALGDVVRRVPCFSLDVGDDQAELGEAVDRLLDQVAG